MTNDRPRPASFGFDADFSDLSTVKPATRAGVAKPSASKPAPPKAKAPKAKTADPKLAKAKQAKPKLAKPETSHKTKTAVPAVLREREQMAEKLAKSMGFESREQKPVVLKKRRRTHHDEPVDQLSIRGPVRVLNEFITYCESEHLSYWQAMEQLLEAKSPS